MTKHQNILCIQTLTLDASIGVYPWEKSVRQRLICDLEIALPHFKGGETDDLSDTIDYQAITEHIQALIQSSHFNLIEKLADTIARTLQEKFHIPWLRLKIAKPGALLNAVVSIVIERGQ